VNDPVQGARDRWRHPAMPPDACSECPVFAFLSDDTPSFVPAPFIGG